MCRSIDGVIADYGLGDPFENPHRYIEGLKTILQRHNASVLLPVHEEIFIVSEHLPFFEKFGTKVCCPLLTTLKSLHDKGNAPLFAGQANVPVPTTLVPDTAGDFRKACKDVGLPLVIKPRWSSGAQGIELLNHHEEVSQACKRFDREPPRGRFIVQQAVPGYGAGVGVLVHNKRVLAVAGHSRIREIPISGGTSTARKTLFDDRLLDAAQRLIEASCFDGGLCMLEFRVHDASNCFWFLEFNPRYWGGVSTEIQSGVDFPKLQLDAHEERLPAGIVVAELLAETRWLLGELRVAYELLSHGQFQRLLGMLRVAPRHRLYVEDFGSRRYLAFFNELREYLRSLRLYGNFGGASCAKKTYFDQLMKEEA
ncbi:MAG: ATP-grasp domain-containing protein [Ramlibacter sp.]|nr:ATP-grasp domain-containing protein [Ramlibacter sp.]